MNDKQIKISVYCMAYNHAEYIRNTLEGFVNQKTNYPFEVLVHDDASTDGTQEIIMEYSRKYPELIIPILQEENKYSQAINVEKEYIFPKMRGEYVAVCEGDDYWSDPSKLQKQIDFLEENLEYSACVHNTEVIDLGKNTNSLLNPETKEYDLKIEHVLVDGGADFHTSSIVYRMKYGKEIYSDYCPEFFTKSMEVGDYPLAIYLVLKGKVRYLPDIMSVYRKGTPGSWTQRMENVKMQIKTERELIEMLESINEYTGHELTDVTNPIIEMRRLRVLKKETNLGVLREKGLRKVFHTIPLRERVKILIKLLFLNKMRYKKF